MSGNHESSALFDRPPTESVQAADGPTNDQNDQKPSIRPESEIVSGQQLLHVRPENESSDACDLICSHPSCIVSGNHESSALFDRPPTESVQAADGPTNGQNDQKPSIRPESEIVSGQQLLHHKPEMNHQMCSTSGGSGGCVWEE